MAIRLCGLILLATCALAVRQLHLFETVPPPHEATVVEMLLSLISVVSGICGAWLLLAGDTLFRPYR